jgi:hypothetical protein
MISERHEFPPPSVHRASRKLPFRYFLEFVNIVWLALICAAFIWLRWKKLDELLRGDPVHWLHEIGRVAGGEIPYRDFAYQYPPLTPFLFGWTLRLFGATFTVAQIFVDVWSVAVVLLLYILTKFLLPPAVRLPACFMLAAVCATSLTNFNLFSYRTYTPALQIGAAGALLLILGMLRSLRQDEVGRLSRTLIITGSAIALLSKPEYAFAACCALILFALIGSGLRIPKTGVIWFHLKLIAMSVLPAAALYLWLARIVGSRNLIAGVSGYGLATYACPWWPTGVGVFGVAAAIGEALLIAAVVSFPWYPRFAAHFGVVYRRATLLAFLGAFVFGAYVFYENWGAWTSARPLIEKLKATLPSILWTAKVLLPVMWVALIGFFYMTFQCFKSGVSREVLKARTELLIVLIVPVAISPRTLFGSTQDVVADVAAASYPFLLILGPYFLWKFLSAVPEVGERSIPSTAIVVLYLVVYGAARIVGGYSLLSDRDYRTLRTEAGPVKIANYFPGLEIYNYLTTHTNKSDYVLELPYGGGLNFASGRRNPIFDTQLFGMAMPSRYQDLDLKWITDRKPKFVIVEDSPQYGTFFGYGAKGDRMCVCPRLVWTPDRRSWDPDFVYPVVRYISQNYHPALRIGGEAILVRSDATDQ